MFYCLQITTPRPHAQYFFDMINVFKDFFSVAMSEASLQAKGF